MAFVHGARSGQSAHVDPKEAVPSPCLSRRIGAVA